MIVSKKVIYVAHPVSDDPLGNCAKAEAWLRFLFLNDPCNVYVAPWIGEVRALQTSPDRDWTPGSEDYERVLADDCEVVRRLDGVITVGGRLSPGMITERMAAWEANKPVHDLYWFASPEQLEETLTRLNESFREYVGFGR